MSALRLLIIALLCAVASAALSDELAATADECAPSIGTVTRAAASRADPRMTVLTFAENKADDVLNPERGWTGNVFLHDPVLRAKVTSGEWFRAGRRVVIAILNLKVRTFSSRACVRTHAAHRTSRGPGRASARAS